jgi:ribosomal-protein-alanine N-acetyltransferase
LTLQGPRLTLTALSAEELERIRWASQDKDAHAMFVERLRADPDARGWWVWLAALPDGQEIGNGGFGGRPGPNRRLTAGYSVHEEHRGKGYATEILALLTAWALARPEVDLVRVTIASGNLPSLRVAEKCGFTATGELAQDDEHGELIVLERRR